jgi:hypothetical protein
VSSKLTQAIRSVEKIACITSIVGGLGETLRARDRDGPMPDLVEVILVFDFFFDDDDDRVLAMTATTGILVAVSRSVR